MARMTLTKTRIAGGVWHGVLTAPGETPQIAVSCGGAPTGYELTPDPATPGQWDLRIPIPADRLADGVQSFVITDASGAGLGHFSVITGEAEDDLRAELALLRAELDLLKRAFRRHCAEDHPGF